MKRALKLSPFDAWFEAEFGPCPAEPESLTDLQQRLYLAKERHDARTRWLDARSSAMRGWTACAATKARTP